MVNELQFWINRDSAVEKREKKMSKKTAAKSHSRPSQEIRKDHQVAFVTLSGRSFLVSSMLDDSTEQSHCLAWRSGVEVGFAGL